MDHEAPALLSAFCRLSLDPGDRGSIIDKLGRITTREAELPATPEPAKMKGLARFRPEEFYGDDDYHPKRDSGKVEVASQPHGYIHLACLDCGTGDRCLYETIVIAFDGACTNNGRADATGAMGVYVGGAFTAAGLRFNEARPIRGKATSQIAELVGAIRAVTLAQQVVARRRRPVGGGVTTDTIVLKSDSEYVVKGMTECMFCLGRAWSGRC